MEGNDTRKEPLNKWVRLARKVIVGAAIMLFLNLLLNAIGWDTWEAFSKKADGWANTIGKHVYRMSPVMLWKSQQDNSVAYYQPEYRTKFLNRVYVWLSNYWYKSTGGPFWIGRGILVLIFVAAILLAVEDHREKRGKLGAALVFPVNVLFKAIILLLSLSLVFIIVYLLIKLLLLANSGVVVPFSSAHLGISMVILTIEEIKGHFADETKERTGKYIFPFLYAKRKKGDS